MNAVKAASDAVSVRIPGYLRDVVGTSVASVAPGTLLDIIAELDAAYPGVADRLLDDSGLRRGVNVYVGMADVRYGEGLATSVHAGETVTILPAA